MLPNLRLSGAPSSPIDSMGDFLGASTVAQTVARSTNSLANSVAAAAAAASRQNQTVTAIRNVALMQPTGWGAPSKISADYAKVPVAWPNNSGSLTNHHHGGNSSGVNSNSMPWATAVKSPPEPSHQSLVANSFDYNSGAIGSWSSHENSSSSKSGWNSDNSSRNDGLPDDGTAIWGNPAAKKTGIDWTEKEASLKPPQPQRPNNMEKLAPKSEPTISSINGTEAWGASVGNPHLDGQISKNDASGNNWGQAPITSSLQTAATVRNENSSPPSNSVWNNLGLSKQKSSDWLASGINCNIATKSRIDDLSNQLEATSLFGGQPSLSTLTKNSPNNSNSNNSNLEHQKLGFGIVGSGSVNNAVNDLKQQMSANFSNDLSETQSRRLNAVNGGMSGSSASGNSNSQSQQLDQSIAATPSRDLLKQMVHQIQLAVQAGHLNAHILNQPMSTPTLQLVYQLLQQIKTLHQLQEIQQRAGLKTDLSSPNNLDIQINQTRQNISLLQKAITQQQATLTKNENLGSSSSSSSGNTIIRSQQSAVGPNNINQSYATISKLSTNTKVPSNINDSSNTDSFRRSSLMDTLSNNNGDSLRSAQAFDANATIDKNLSLLIRSAASSNNILGSTNNDNTASTDFTSKAQHNSFTSGNADQHQEQSSSTKVLLPAQLSSSATGSSTSTWSAFGSDEFAAQQQSSVWPNQLRISSSVSQDQHQLSAFDMIERDYGVSNKAWRDSSILSGDGKDNLNVAPGTNINRPAPPPGLLSNFGPMIGGSSASNGLSTLLDSSKSLNNSASGDEVHQQQQQQQSRELSSSLWSGAWFD